MNESIRIDRSFSTEEVLMGEHSFRKTGTIGRFRKRRSFGRSTRLRLELLEDRRLLSIGYDTVDPSWFAIVDSVDIAGPLPLDFTTFENEDSEPSRWIVRLTPEAVSSVESISETSALLLSDGVDFDIVRGLGLPGMILVESISDASDVQQVLISNPYIASFEPDRIVTGQLTPNDPSFGNMLYLDNQGQSGGSVDVDIDAPEAWDLTIGNPSVVVGVIDSGIDSTHEDLYMNVWINQGEIPVDLKSAMTDVDLDGIITFYDLNNTQNADYVTDRLDDGNNYIDAQDLLVDTDWADDEDTDGNGFIDDLFGWDFVNGDNNPTDDHSHGTHVAGTIGATGNNAKGVVGVNWETSLMAIKFLDETRSGSICNAIQSINYATMMNEKFDVNVLATNNSWGYYGSLNVLCDETPDVLRAAINANEIAGMLFIAAAGNGDALGRGINNDEDPRYAFYPASAPNDNIISVAASDLTDQLAWFSNYGATTTDIAAPGLGILSTEPSDGYASRNGTSMAAPLVTGAAALIWSKNLDASYTEVKEAILQGGDPITELQGRVASGRRLNLHESLLVDTIAPRSELIGNPDVTGAGAAHHDFIVEYTDNKVVSHTLLDGSEIVLTRWDDVELPVTLPTAVEIYEGGARIVATYRVAAPDGVWGLDDDGDYSIALAENIVQDIQGNKAASGVFGSFNIDTTDGLLRVYDFEDSVDVMPGDTFVADSEGRSTLRAAVMEANALTFENTIRLRAGTYTFALPGDGEEASATGDLDITDDLIIRGAGADVTTINADSLDRLFHIRNNATVTLRDLTLSGGSAHLGGALLIESGSTLMIFGSSIENNTATTDGGGIANLGSLTIEQSALLNNTAVNGGALLNQSTASLTNITISGNDSTNGGGILNDSGATLSLLHATIADNTATSSGGGVHNVGTTNVSNTIISTNTSPLGPDAFGSLTSLAPNILGDSAGTTGWQAHDLLNIDPLLTSLQDNGGATLTYGLLNGSPAIDAGENAVAPDSDQRGIARPQDADADDVATTDIGAIEKYFAEISGIRFRDDNANGVHDEGEELLEGLIVYVDRNNDRIHNPDEPFDVTDENGEYLITGLEPGVQSIVQPLESGWDGTFPNYGLETKEVSLGQKVIQARDGDSQDAYISGDGRFVVFHSSATNLIPNDANGALDVFVYDRQEDVIERVSVANDGTEGNASSIAFSISYDGRFISFASDATNLVESDDNATSDVFVYDRQEDVVEMVSVNENGIPGDGPSIDSSISADGRYVAFESEASNLVLQDTNNISDIFVYDRQDNTVERINVPASGSKVYDSSYHPSISADGQLVAFYSYGWNLVPNDGNGKSDVFVYNRTDDSIEMISIANNESQGNGDSYFPSISADGLFVAFVSSATNLVSGDNNDSRDIFVYDRQAAAIERVSVTNIGVEGDNDSYYPSISADGQFVAFNSSAENFTTGDAIERSDVYVYDRQENTIERVSVDDNGTQGYDDSYFPSISADGQVVAFESYAENLASKDNNELKDIFTFDRQSDTIEMVNLGYEQTQAEGESDFPSMSADGRYIAYESWAFNLNQDETDGYWSILVYDRQEDALERVSVTNDGILGVGNSAGASISDDGRFVSFGSGVTNFDPNDTNGLWDIYLYDRLDNTIDRVSVGAGGVQEDGHSHLSSISTNGRFIVFLSEATNLVSGDDNWSDDLFLYDRVEETLERITVNSEGIEANDDSYASSISADGRFIAFESWATNLVPDDTNNKIGNTSAV
jgi:subtilisin family serine protease